MPSKSKSQQRLFGWVHAIQTGQASSKGAPKKIRDMAKRVSPEDAKDFASTKTEGLPEKKASFLDNMFMRGFIDRALGRI